MFETYPTVAAVREADPFALAAALSGLSLEDLGAMSADAAEVVVAATQRAINALAARQAAAVDVFAGRVDDDVQRHHAELQADLDARAGATGRGPRMVVVPGSDQVAASMLAPVLRVAPRTMATRMRRASELVEDLPRTYAAAWAGDLEPWRADAVVRGSAGVRHQHLVELEARVFADDVLELTGPALGERARRAALRADPEGVAGAVRDSARRRRVVVRPGELGLAHWSVDLPTPVSQRMWAAVDALAQEYLAAEPAHTVDTARADALGDLVLAQARVETSVELVLPTGSAAHDRPGAPVVEHAPPADPVVESMLAGEWTARTAAASDLEWELAFTAGAARRVDRNPHLERDARGEVWFVPGAAHDPRHGVLLPDHLARLLADPDVRVRVSGGPPGSADGPPRARRRYRPGAALADKVRRRDGTCRFPGCATPARRCELDHVRPFPGGPTCEDNLLCLCTTHHGFKHHAGWRLRLEPDGSAVWTAPNGRSHTTHPKDRHDEAA